MKKIKLSILNCAFWIELVLSYVLPFKERGNSQYEVGFPMPFLSVHNGSIGVNPLMSMSLNPFPLLINIIVIYFVIEFGIRAYYKFKKT